jgi:hypothetical protein
MKRDKPIDRLRASTDYADYFANKWSAVLRNKKANGNYSRGAYEFHDWIRDNLHHNRPYDQIARDIVAASGEVGQNPPVVWFRSLKTIEQQVEDSAQLFLGLRIQCARCHHHPFERWSQNDYYGFGVLPRVQRKPGLTAAPTSSGSFTGAAQRPDATRERARCSARGPGSAPMDISPDRDPRLALADGWPTRRTRSSPQPS